MIELKITGTNYKEIKKQIFELANDIATDSDDDLEIQSASVRNDVGHTGVGNTTPMGAIGGMPTLNTSFTAPNAMTGTQGQSQVAAPTRKRRSKAEVEADKAAKLQAAQAEVVAAQATHTPAPIAIPQVPTTQHVVNIPSETHAPQAVPVSQPVAPPPVQAAPPGAYTLETFKTNLVMILNGLLGSGKLNSTWISETSKVVFGGADIWLWSQNQEKIAELFGMFIEWGFIQEFKV